MIRVIENSVTIHAPPSEVWRALTDPDLMKQWMAEPVMGSGSSLTGRSEARRSSRGTTIM